MKWSFWSSFEGTTTGTGLAVARTRGVLASLFAATRLSRAIQAPTRLGVDTCALALWTSGRALKKKATHGGHPVAAFSRFFSRGVEGEYRHTDLSRKIKFPPRAIFFPKRRAMRRRARFKACPRKPRALAARQRK